MAMRVFIVGASLLCVIGTALAGVEEAHREDAIIDTLSRGPRNTATNECGIRGLSHQTRIAGGKNANVGEFPWHVALFRTVVNEPSMLDCGGTLISRTLVLTAAHCFWDERQNKLKPVNIYKIAAGKHWKNWSLRQPETQIRDVVEINVPRRYRDRQSNFQYDIAVVRLASGVDFNAWVMPVCMDWTKRYEADHLSVGIQGTIVGWGATGNNVPSQVLKKVDLPFVDFDTCFNALQDNVKKLYTDDKFCAGFVNESRSVCKGDSGSGLVFETGDRYYLRGVASVNFRPATINDPCYSQLYNGFTLVSQYLAWIKTFVDNEQTQPGTVTQKPPKKTISQEMCELYSTAVYDSVELPSSEPIKVSTCAMSPSGVISQRLVSQPREFPHVVALWFFNKAENKPDYRCNGNLISERFVLTTAECVTVQHKGLTLAHVRLGTVSLMENNTEEGVLILGVERTYLHPEYNNELVYNDLALLKLNETVSFNGYVRPACLDPNPSLLDQETVTAASWGRTSWSDEVYKNLLHGDVRIVDDDECQKLYANKTSGNRKIPNGITPEHMLCYNPVDRSTDCSLTAGSPLMVKLTEPFCMYRIVGIVSFGRRPCSPFESPLPTVSMRISAFTPWIESVVWPDDVDDLVSLEQLLNARHN